MAAGKDSRMDIAYDGLLSYPGYEGMDGLCHVRLYVPRRRWHRPVAIVGGLDDNPGTSITGAAEALRTQVRRRLPAARRRLQIVEHYPEGLAGGGPSFELLRFKPARRRASSSFARIGRRSLSREQVQRLIGGEVRIWPAGGYTAAAVAGEEGHAQLLDLIERTAPQARRLRESLRFLPLPGESSRRRRQAAPSSCSTASS